MALVALLDEAAAKRRWIAGVAWRREAVWRGASIGRGVHFVGRPILSLHPESQISIGDGSLIVSVGRGTALGVARPSIFRTLAPGASITIAEHVGMSGGVVCAAVSIDIGAGTLMGADVLIADTDFHPVHSDARRYEKMPPGETNDRITIGRNVFLGARSMVLKGVEIGNNAVIGAGSVVTRSIASNAIAAGNPAKIIGEVQP